jgi:hypothetical protein
MTAIDLRTEIVQMIKSERDTSILEAIRTLLYKLRQADQDDDLTDEEVAELDAQRADRISGKVKFISEEESIRMIRAGRKA